VASDRDLPGAPRSIGRSMRLAYESEPRLFLVSFALVAGSWIPDALVALWLKFLVDGVTGRHEGLIAAAAAGLAGSAALSWLLRTIGARLELRFRERATIGIEAHVMRLQASVAGLELHERPAYLDRLQLLRDQVWLLNHIYASAMNTVGSVARLAIAVGLLVSIHPALALLAVFAIPTVVVSSWRAGVERGVEERSAPSRRLAKHLFDLGTTAGPGKEIRVTRTAALIVRRWRETWTAWYARNSRARWWSALWRAAAWALFGAAYAAAIVFVASVLRASSGSVVLALAAGGNLSRYLGITVSQAEFLRWCLDASRRLVWLEDYAAARREPAGGLVPGRLRRGLRLEGVSFRYPGTDAWVLRDVDLELPAGRVVAIVGENGAGKTTLVKLLCRFYDPTEGRITVDGTDLASIPADAWRAHLAGAFQDFMRYELRARRTIGLGDVARLDELPALDAAVLRGGATDVLARLPRGLETQLGPTWHEGVDLSFGQWQKLALARGFMRDEPLLLVLDEPSAALDAETEHALFERFAEAARTSGGRGRVTVLVSHRFSTVRMADLIVVLDASRVVEAGSHEELTARGGLYAELYEIQARAYR
jgi:ATP-binding cassette subfamily B protein